MNRIFLVITMASVMLAGARGLAADSASQPTISKRQLVAQIVGCMRKQMSADNAILYNEAMKACKDQVNRQSDNNSGSRTVASNTLTKP